MYVFITVSTTTWDDFQQYNSVHMQYWHVYQQLL